MTTDGTAGTGVDDWDTHWEDYGEANERNPAQHYRRGLALSLVGRFGDPVRLLDIGSGNGEMLVNAERRWPTAGLAGLELSPEGVAVARRKVPRARIEVRDLIRDPQPRPQDADWATHAVCSEVLEHVDDPVLLLRNARRWLAPGCRLVITVPGGPMSAFDRHIGHRRHFSPGDLADVISAAGLQVRLTGGAGFPIFNLYRMLVVARGEHLVRDAAAEARDTPQAKLIRAAMTAFRPLFWMTVPRPAWGWQTFGVAQEPRG